MNHLELLYRGAIRPVSMMILAYVLPVLAARGCRDATRVHPDIGIRPARAAQEAAR